ncbi:MAG TPA: HDOD domain-containing protein [Anaerolineae bacterium]|nr:HDOD domain-containing protein [Anaerolineae bacterium]
MNRDRSHCSTDCGWIPLQIGDIDPTTVEIIETLVNQIPDLPVSVQKILQSVYDEKSKIKEIADIVASDPVLTSRILRVVNSTYYGLREKVDNIYLAIVLLGLNEVRNVALHLGVSNVLGKGFEYSGYDTRSLWMHSYMVSLCAETFAGSEDQYHAGVLLTVGLLHDIGKFALAGIGHLFKQKGIKLQDLKFLPTHAYLLQKEEHLFGVNHTIVGGMLAKRWNFSERTQIVVEYHHHPSFFGIESLPQMYAEVISFISLADLIVNYLAGAENHPPEPHPYFFEILGFNPPAEKLITDELKSKLSKAREFLHSLA